MDLQQQIELFLAGSPHAVAGASEDRGKYGNKVLRAYTQHARTVYPINPMATTVEGLPAFASIADAPQPIYGLSIITPPRITEQIVAEAVRLRVQNIWMQPGAESQTAIERARASGANVIAGGPCLLVALGFRETET